MCTSSNTANTTNSKDRSCDRMDEVDFEALADRSLQLLHESQCGNHAASNCHLGRFNDYQQVFIAVGGTPGSGKSFIAHEVCKVINERNPNGDDNVPEAVVIGMDGYHLSRELLQKTANNDNFQPDGKKDWSFDDLMMRRGAPFTYCPKNFVQDLKQAKERGEGSFPVYSREEHDPVSDGVSMNQKNKIVFVEGLYLLCLNDPDWKPLGDLWDDKWYIEVSMEETKKRLIERHLKTWNKKKTKQWGGDDEEAAAKKAEANDMKNAKFVLEGSLENADIIIRNETIPEDDENNADCGAAEQ